MVLSSRLCINPMSHQSREPLLFQKLLLCDIITRVASAHVYQCTASSTVEETIRHCQSRVSQLNK